VAPPQCGAAPSGESILDVSSGENAAAGRDAVLGITGIDPRMSYPMADRPFGAFDRFIGFNPPLFL
jgi:hypothetical protein